MLERGMIQGIHHVAIKCGSVERFEETLHFYHEILGLAIARRWGEGANAAVMIDTGAGYFEIFANGEDDGARGKFHHLALAAADTDACVAAVREAGYEITKEPTDIVIPSEPPYPARIAFCKGPMGEELEFFKVLG